MSPSRFQIPERWLRYSWNPETDQDRVVLPCCAPKLKCLLRLLLWSCDQPRLCRRYTTRIKWCRHFKETPTCTELILAHSEGLHTKVESEEGETAVDAVVLLLVAHVGAAESCLPQTQVIVRPRKGHPLRDTQTLASFRVQVLRKTKYTGSLHTRSSLSSSTKSIQVEFLCVLLDRSQTFRKSACGSWLLYGDSCRLTLVKVNVTFTVSDTSTSTLFSTPQDPDAEVTLGFKFISSYFYSREAQKRRENQTIRTDCGRPPEDHVTGKRTSPRLTPILSPKVASRQSELLTWML